MRLRQYFKQVGELRPIVSEEVGRIKWWIGFALSVLLLFNRELVKLLKAKYEGLPPWLGPFLFCGIVIHALIRRLAKLKEDQEPKFDILFGEGGSFDQTLSRGITYPDGTTDKQHQFRIGVQNLGNSTIENMKVQVEKFVGIAVPYLPVELVQMHDIAPPYKRSFNLNVGTTQYIDVVMKRERAKGFEFPTVVCYAIPVPLNDLPKGSYEMTILVSGHNVQPKRRSFRFGVDDEERLWFRAVD